MTTAEAYRRHGFSESTFYKLEVEVWRFGGDESQAAEGVKDENGKLTRMLDAGGGDAG